MTEKVGSPDVRSIRKCPFGTSIIPSTEFPDNNIVVYREKDSDNNSFLDRLSSEIRNDDDRLGYCGWEDLSRVIPGFGKRPKPRPIPIQERGSWNATLSSSNMGRGEV